MKAAVALLVLATSTAQADRCYNLAIKKNPFLGQNMHAVWATIDIAAEGQVTRVVFEGIPTDDSGYAGCVRGGIKRWQFGPGDAAMVRFAIP